MKFQAGVSGNPKGRPRGIHGGRTLALIELDQLLAMKKNRRAMRAALQKEFTANPAGFFRTMVMPLLPREAKVSLEDDGVIHWRSLLSAGVEPGPAVIDVEAVGTGESSSGEVGGPA